MGIEGKQARVDETLYLYIKPTFFSVVKKRILATWECIKQIKGLIVQLPHEHAVKASIRKEACGPKQEKNW